MRQNITAAILCAIALTSCSVDGPADADLPSSARPRAITLTAGIGNSVTPAFTGRGNALSGPVEDTGFPADTDSLFAVTAYRGDAAPTTNGETYFSNETVNSDADGTPGFATPQYYPADDGKLYFYAYSPVCGGTYTADGEAGPTVRWKLTGAEDIMYANDTRGISKTDNKKPQFDFAHRLNRIRFRLIQGDSFGDGIYADTIAITNCHTEAKLNLADGSLTFSGDKSPVMICGVFYINYEFEAPEIGQSLLCEPVDKLDLEIKAGGLTYKTTVTLTGPDDSRTDNPAAGVSYLVTLTFHGSTINPAAVMEKWGQGGDATGEIK